MPRSPEWSQQLQLPIQADEAAQRVRLALATVPLRRPAAFRSPGKLTATTWPRRKTLGNTLTVQVRELDPHGDRTEVTVASRSSVPPWIDFGSNRELVERIVQLLHEPEA